MFDYTRSQRKTRALVHLNHLSYNLQTLKGLLKGSPQICLAVKADAYGHGALEVSRFVTQKGLADYLAVSNVDEGRELREGGIRGPLILLGYVSPAEYEGIVDLALEPFVGDSRLVQALDRLVGAKKAPSLGVHLKVDTGMGRLGCTPDEAPHLAEQIHRCAGLRMAGLCTHFPVSDSIKEEDRAFTRKQIRILQGVKETLRSKGLDPGLLHAANSGGVCLHPDSHFAMVRLGIGAYGYPPPGGGSA